MSDSSSDEEFASADEGEYESDDVDSVEGNSFPTVSRFEVKLSWWIKSAEMFLKKWIYLIESYNIHPKFYWKFPFLNSIIAYANPFQFTFKWKIEAHWVNLNPQQVQMGVKMLRQSPHMKLEKWKLRKKH